MTDSESASVYHLVAFAFEGKDRAKEIVKEIKKSDALAGVKVINSAVISRDEKGKVKFSEIRGMSTTKGATIGGGAGLLLAVLGSGGLLLPVLAGTAAGGLLAKHRDKKTLGKELQELTDAMTDDSSALLALVEDKEAESLINDMDGFNANVITVTLGDEASGIIESMLVGEVEISPELLEDGDDDDDDDD